MSSHKTFSPAGQAGWGRVRRDGRCRAAHFLLPNAARPRRAEHCSAQAAGTKRPLAIQAALQTVVGTHLSLADAAGCERGRR